MFDRTNSHSPEYDREDETSDHTEELGSLLRLSILDSSEKGVCHLENVHPEEEEAKNLKDRPCYDSMKVVCRDPGRSKVESSSDDNATDYLGDECIAHERFDSSPVFFDDIFREEVIQALCHTEIMIDSQKSDETDDTIENSEFFDREII